VYVFLAENVRSGIFIWEISWRIVMRVRQKFFKNTSSLERDLELDCSGPCKTLASMWDSLKEAWLGQRPSRYDFFRHLKSYVSAWGACCQTACVHFLCFVTPVAVEGTAGWGGMGLAGNSCLKCLGFLSPNRLRANIFVSSWADCLSRDCFAFQAGPHNHSVGAGVWCEKATFCLFV
jgi:hypothetical protein